MPPDEKRRGDPTAEVEEAERKPTGRKKDGSDEVQARSNRSGERETTLTLKISFIYHIRNNTCIYLRVKRSNI
jgi:hypothetical protein